MCIIKTFENLHKPKKNKKIFVILRDNTVTVWSIFFQALKICINRFCLYRHTYVILLYAEVGSC